MRTIFKYPLPGQKFNPVTLMMPRGALVRHVAGQGDAVTLWAEVDTDAPLEARVFGVSGTGWDLAEDRSLYLGTAFLPDGTVWHVHEHLTRSSSA